MPDSTGATGDGRNRWRRAAAASVGVVIAGTTFAWAADRPGSPAELAPGSERRFERQGSSCTVIYEDRVVYADPVPGGQTPCEEKGQPPG